MSELNSSNLDGIRIVYGKRPREHEKEFTEFMCYESGRADIDASQVKGPFDEPWLNVIHAYEPASMPAFEQVLRIDTIRERIRGKVLDVGAGTCWLTAKASLLATVDQVFALDLSEKFACTTGVRILRHFNAELHKITFVISDFNEIPLGDETVDCALLFATIHHSLSPIKTLQEVARCLKKKGTLMILENPSSTIKIQGARKKSLELSKSTTEVAYTKRELDYLIQVANIGTVQCFPLDILSRGGLKMVLRRILRFLTVEDLLVNPPTYLFLVAKS